MALKMSFKYFFYHSTESILHKIMKQLRYSIKLTHLCIHYIAKSLCTPDDQIHTCLLNIPSLKPSTLLEGFPLDSVVCLWGFVLIRQPEHYCCQAYVRWEDPGCSRCSNSSQTFKLRFTQSHSKFFHINRGKPCLHVFNLRTGI